MATAMTAFEQVAELQLEDRKASANDVNLWLHYESWRYLNLKP